MTDHDTVPAVSTGHTAAALDVHQHLWPKSRRPVAGTHQDAVPARQDAVHRRRTAVLLVAELAGTPVLVHPGPVTRHPLEGTVPGWWAPVVGYVG